MIDQSKQIEKLLEQSTWTAEERQSILDVIENSDHSDLKEIIQRLYYGNIESGRSIKPVISEKLLKRIHQKAGFNKKEQKTKLIRLWTWIAAACFVGFLGLSIFLRFKNTTKQPVAQTLAFDKKYKNDIQPGGDKAVLTLADGSAIILEESKNGLLTQQGNAKIIKQNGRLDYNSSGSADHLKMYNSITTPRGGQYQVTFTDGTKVWLNAASSIRFPVVFEGNYRKVEITGEAYFEVTKNRTMPFKVKANNSEIEVLGTHFNVNAYDDEAAVKTTLLEGKVKVSALDTQDRSPQFLKPGSQAAINKDGKINIKDHADTEEAVAWMNGFFQFKSADLKTILRQIARWYDVSIEYKGIADMRFTGQLTRNENVSQVLKELALTLEVHFKIDGRKIIVSH